MSVFSFTVDVKELEGRSLRGGTKDCFLIDGSFCLWICCVVHKEMRENGQGKNIIG